jgi:hypothetical protein
MLLCGKSALKQKVCSLIQGLLCARTCTRCSKTSVYVLTLRSSRNQVKLSNDFNFYMLPCYTFQQKCVVSTVESRLPGVYRV